MVENENIKSDVELATEKDNENTDISMKAWYIATTYSAHENKVAENIKTYTMYMIPVYLPKNYFEREELLYRVSKVFNIDLGHIKSSLEKVPKNSYESVEISESITINPTITDTIQLNLMS